jgi:hypothetical protein
MIHAVYLERRFGGINTKAGDRTCAIHATDASIMNTIQQMQNGESCGGINLATV